MEVAEIIESIRAFDGKFARRAVEAAIARREDVTPALLAILEEVAEKGAGVYGTGDYIAHLYAMFLLAQFRETRAYPLMVRITLLPSDDLDNLLGDFISGHLDSALASVCGGDLTGIKSIIECETANEWARGAAIDSLVVLVAAGEISRTVVVDYFATLYRGRLARSHEYEVVWSLLVVSTADLYPEELMADIEQVYADGLMDTMMMRLGEVRADLAAGKEAVLARLAADPHHRLVTDTVKEYGSWACFHPKEQIRSREMPESDGWSPAGSKSGSTYRRPAPKVGRNDPCPCASGKKYKKCCGQ
jgi:hypothetical protein